MINIIKSTKFYMPLIYIASGIIIYIIISRTINKLSKINTISSHMNKEISKRKATVINLINNIIKYIIAIIVIILILNIYGVNTTSIIASLGAISVIIGLAFQDIIKDFLAGVFIIFDNAYAVGDWIEINGFKGEVISLGLKTTKIRSYTGEVKTISNSSFTEVINYSINHNKLLMNIPIPYGIEIDKVEKALNNIKEKIEQNKNVFTMNLLGIDNFSDSSIEYTIEIECQPMTEKPVKRETLKYIKQAFEKEKIEIPFNQLDIHIKENNK